MQRHILLYLILLLIGVQTPVVSQSFRQLSMKEGLSDLVVNTIYKDSLGYMWFGTSCSLERFDGHRFHHFMIPEINDTKRDVNAIVEMPYGEIWFGNQAGLWRIDAEQAMERVATDSITETIYALARRDHQLFVGTGSGLYIWENGRVHRVLIVSDVLDPANTIRGLALDEDNLWIATGQGLYAMRLSDQQIASYTPRDRKMNISYSSIYLHRGVLYLGLEEWGIVPFDREKGRFGEVIPVGPVTAISSSSKDNLLYAATNGRGIFVISTPDNRIVRQICHHPESKDGIRSNSVYSLLVDREGILWAGLFQIGVDYSLYQNKLFSSYIPKPLRALHHAAIRTMTFSGQTMLFGTRDGLFLIDEQRNFYRQYVHELRSSMVMCSCFYNGQFYVGTFGGGLYVVDPQTGAIRDFENTVDTFVRGKVFDLVSDHQGYLWIGTSDGLFCYQGTQQMLHFTKMNSQLPHSCVYQIFFDSTGRGWICTAEGLAWIDSGNRGTLSTHFPQRFIHKKLIRHVSEGYDHHLYFCPDKGNLFITDLSLSHFEEISHPELEGKSLQFAKEDSTNWLWIGTNDGLFRYRRDEDKMDSYGFLDGLPTSNFLNCSPQRSAEGILWFGSSEGVICTDVRNLQTPREYPYQLRFTAVEQGHSYTLLPSTANLKPLKIASAQGALTLYFSDFTYTDTDELTFEYRVGQEEWHTLSGGQSLTLYNLTGRNTLQLRHRGREESAIALDIVAPMLTPDQWAWLLSVLATAGCCYLFFRYYILKRRRIKRRMAKQSMDLPKSSIQAEGAEQTAKQLPEQPEIEVAVSKYKQVNLSEEDCRVLAQTLEELMQRDKPYLNPKLKLNDLGKMLDIPTYKLSYLFSQHLEQTFYDYINEYRIREFKTLVAAGSYKSYTINSLIEQCGFTSRTSFFRNFKALTGMTPNEYISLNG